MLETRTNRKGLHSMGKSKAVKLEGPPPPTGGAQSTHKRELVLPTSTASWGEAASQVQLTEDVTDTAQTLHEETDKLHSPTGQSSIEDKYPSLTLNLLLSSGVSCASISSTTCGSSTAGSSWTSAMLLFLATPLRAATPNFCTSVCGTALYCRSKE